MRFIVRRDAHLYPWPLYDVSEVQVRKIWIPTGVGRTDDTVLVHRGIALRRQSYDYNDTKVETTRIEEND